MDMSVFESPVYKGVHQTDGSDAQTRGTDEQISDRANKQNHSSDLQSSGTDNQAQHATEESSNGTSSADDSTHGVSSQVPVRRKPFRSAESSDDSTSYSLSSNKSIGREDKSIISDEDAFDGNHKSSPSIAKQIKYVSHSVQVIEDKTEYVDHKVQIIDTDSGIAYSEKEVQTAESNGTESTTSNPCIIASHADTLQSNSLNSILSLHSCINILIPLLQTRQCDWESRGKPITLATRSDFELTKNLLLADQEAVLTLHKLFNQLLPVLEENWATLSKNQTIVQKAADAAQKQIDLAASLHIKHKTLATTISRLESSAIQHETACDRLEVAAKKFADQSAVIAVQDQRILALAARNKELEDLVNVLRSGGVDKGEWARAKSERRRVESSSDPMKKRSWEV